MHPRGERSTGKVAEDRSTMPDPVGPPPSLTLPERERFTLSNGLDVVLATRRGVPQVEFRFIADAGYATDAPERPGLASMAESLRTRGTPTRDAIAISEDADALGAQLSSSVSRDHSTIRLGAVRPFLDDSMALFADVLRNPTFPETQFDRLRKRREASIAQEKAQPSGLVSRTLPTLLYGADHPYAQPPSGTGTVASLKAMTPEAFHDYQSQWIRPDNAVLLVTGDIDQAELKPLLERHLGDWGSQTQAVPPEKRSLAVPQRDDERVFVIDRPGAAQSYVVAARTAPPTGNPDDIAFELLNEVLGGTFTARLNQELRVKRGWSYGVGSSLSNAIGPRPFYVYGAIQTDRTAEAAAVILDELAGIRREKPPTEEELSRAARSLTLTLPGNNQTLTQVTGSIAHLLRFDLPDDYYRDYVPAVNATTPAQSIEAARRLIQPQAMTWLFVGDRAQIEKPLRALFGEKLRFLDRDGNPVDD